MSDYGILFQDEMVRAILDGRKDVTRRTSDVWAKRKAGDRLWVRECWAPVGCESGMPVFERTPLLDPKAVDVTYRADWLDDEQAGEAMTWRPSIHMPRWASRLTLEVVSIDVEIQCEVSALTYRALPHVDDREARREGVADRAAYLDLWERINGPSFGGNLWRIEFRVVGGAK